VKRRQWKTTKADRFCSTVQNQAGLDVCFDS
jgi:hypothetical protein